MFFANMSSSDYCKLDLLSLGFYVACNCSSDVNDAILHYSGTERQLWPPQTRTRAKSPMLLEPLRSLAGHIYFTFVLLRYQ